jgi:serine/threonine protein kinase
VEARLVRDECLRSGGAGDPAKVGPLVPGDVLLDRYVLLSVLGRGGAGVVYKAHDRGTQSPVAIKWVDPERIVGVESRAALYRELRIGRRIDDPNVCRLYDVVELNGSCLLVMEFAEKGTLADTLAAAGGSRALGDRLEDARAVIAGLAAIHRSGVVHRDVKPENILRMGDGRLVLADFGLARPVAHTLITSHAAGTPGYLAPETVDGGRPSQATDVWALGLVLHQILTGTRPESLAEISIHRRFPELSATAAARTLAKICRACLQPDPRLRPATAVAVQAHLASSPSRWSLRPRMLGASLIVLAALGLIGNRWREGRSPVQPRTPVNLAAPADWSRSRLLMATPSDVCISSKSFDSSVVKIRTLPEAAIELDLRSGLGRPVLDTQSLLCPSLSPDGGAALFSRRTGGKFKVRHLRLPERTNERVLMVGTSPVWLPSGKEFLFVTEGQRLARADLTGKILHFARTGAQPFAIPSVAVDDRGQWAAASVVHQAPAYTTDLELYDLRAMQRVGTWNLGRMRLFLIEFDRSRGTFQFASAGPDGFAQWSELTEDRQVRPLARMPNRNIAHALRVDGGYVFGSAGKSVNHPVYSLGSKGGVELVAHAREIDTSADGSLVYLHSLGAFRDSQVMLRRPGQQPVVVSEGDFFGIDISPDGRGVTYARALAGEIFHCDLSGERPVCERVGADSWFPGVPAARMNPAGDALAYVATDDKTFEGMTFLRLLSLRTREVRELVKLDLQYPCDLRWLSNTTLRVCPAAGDKYLELDVRGGRQKSYRVSGDAMAPCREPPPASGLRFELRRGNSYEVRYVRDDSGGQPALPLR